MKPDPVNNPNGQNKTRKIKYPQSGFNITIKHESKVW